MKKFIIPLVTAAVIVSILFAGCVPGAPEAPPVTPPPVEPPVTPPPVEPPVTPPPPTGPTDMAGVPIPPETVPWVDPDHVWMNPYEGLAIKPDGTPYHFGTITVWMGDDWQVAKEGLYRSYVERAGGEWTTLDPNLDTSVQFSMFEDVTAIGEWDAITSHPLDEDMLNPAIEAAVAAGIPVFCDTAPATTPAVTSIGWFNYAGSTGSVIIGEYFRDIVEETGEPLTILTIWGGRPNPLDQYRDEGFRRGIADNPLITIVESVDCWGDATNIMNAIMDGFAAHPEIGAIFPFWGDASGFVTGLQSVDRYFPIGHPEHVMVVPEDVDVIAMGALKDGYFDAIGSTGAWQISDPIIKMFFLNVIMGQPVPKEIDVPISLITPDNWQTLRLWGGTVCFSEMPMGDWEKWPTLDTSEIGLPTPTVEMRKELLGY